jgi:hypothetical protein
MNRLVAFVLVAALASLMRADLLACGDKFLVVTRGTRFQRPSARQPASVLLYANPTSRFTEALSRLPVDVTLKKAGYRTTTVTTTDALTASLQSGQWDVIVADLADMPGVRVLSKDLTAIVLPVTFETNSAQLKRLKQQYHRVLNAPTRSQSILDAIDDVLATKPKVAKMPSVG